MTRTARGGTARQALKRPPANTGQTVDTGPTVTNIPRKALPAINLGRYTGCGWCVDVCPPHVLSLHTQQPNGWGPKHATLHDAGHCTGCALCAVRCPVDAITMLRISQNL